MAEEEGDQAVVSLQDVLEEDQQLENTANAVLGDSDDTQCTYPKGYVYRQALYACATCTPGDKPPAGVCLACSLHCHDGHTLYELYTKRHFRCDCGNEKFSNFKCSILPDKERENVENKYNQNFRGVYCTCSRPYPDPEDQVEDEMIQCCICEDWFHSRHLTGDTPDIFSEMACDSCTRSHDFLSAYQLRTHPVKILKDENGASVNVTDSPNTKEKGESSSIKDDSKGELTSKADNTNEGETSCCELTRRRALLSNCEGDRSGAGFFEENWRAQLCTCASCKELYRAEGVLFLLDQEDSVGAYEKRGVARPSAHDAGMAALGTTLDRVQQVEVFHQYNELKTELSDFLKDFARQGKVVSKRDIEGFFEEMQDKKRQKLDNGDDTRRKNLDKMDKSFLHPLTYLDWKQCTPLPTEVHNAQIACLNGKVYVGDTMKGSLYSFTPADGIDSPWTTFEKLPTSQFALVAHKSDLLLVGGLDEHGKTMSQVFTLSADGTSFHETIPPMTETRGLSSAVSSGSALVVAGGLGGKKYLSSVEIFEDGKWRRALSLPTGAHSMQSVLNGDEWYLIRETGQVYNVSLKSLVSGRPDQPSPWKSLPDVPNNRSAAVFYGDCLLSIGGNWQSPQNTIHAFSTRSKSWVHAANIPEKVYSSSAVVLPGGKVMLVGGKIDSIKREKKTFIASYEEKQFRGDDRFGLFDIRQLKESSGIDLLDNLATVLGRNVPILDHITAHKIFENSLKQWETGAGGYTIEPIWNHLFSLVENAGLRDLAKRIQEFLGGSSQFGYHPSIPQGAKIPPEWFSHDVCQDNSMSEFQANVDPKLELRGVDVIANTSMIVTSSKQNFQWPGYGLKLHIPPNSLPAGVDQCRLDIVASTAGSYKLPDNHELVSAIYWIRPNPLCKFLKRITVEVQHCVRMSSANCKLSFVRAACSQEKLPYNFGKLEGYGSFTEHSSYGSIELNHFSAVGVVGEDVEKLYTAGLYYLRRDPRTMDIHFIITPDLEVHVTSATEYYQKKNAREGAYLPVIFRENQVSLNIPMPDGVQVENWRIKPIVQPTILKKVVNSYQPGRRIPCCQLKTYLPQDLKDSTSEKEYVIVLEGADCPNEMIIELDPFTTNHYRLNSQHSSQESAVSSAMSETVSVTMDEIVERVGIDKALLERECPKEYLRKIAYQIPNWRKFAEGLGLSEAEELHIHNDQSLDAGMKAYKMLKLWKKANDFKATYASLIAQCLQPHVNNSELATKICEIAKEDPSVPLITERKRSHNNQDEPVPPKRKCAGED